MLCQVIPGAPISVEERGDGTERLQLHARVRKWLRVCRSGVVIAQELVRAGEGHVSKAMQVDVQVVRRA